MALHEGEKLGLVGRNGGGKSSLMRILAGNEKPDRGTVSLRQGLRVLRDDRGFFPRYDAVLLMRANLPAPARAALAPLQGRPWAQAELVALAPDPTAPCGARGCVPAPGACGPRCLPRWRWSSPLTWIRTSLSIWPAGSGPVSDPRST